MNEKNSNQELVTIIVPIYNVESYLKECLDSIQQQTYPHFECIMVNDGSTDSSVRIAEEYLSDSRFRLINQNNQGLASARNTGIRYIKDSSSFVSFVDSDDYVHPTFLEKLIRHIEEDVDVIEGLIEMFYDGDSTKFHQYSDDKMVLTSRKEKIEKILSHELRVSIFPRLIRKNILTDNFFPDEWIFEDLAIFPELVTLSRKWIKTEDVIYGYRVRQNSITTSEFSKKKLDIFKVFEKFDAFFEDEDVSIKLLIEKIKYDQLSWHDTMFVPQGSEYKYLYKSELNKILGQIEKYQREHLHAELISIIVPIYNTEKYLHECLDSIINQTYANFEVLLVNDGSTDSSGIICQEYVKNDSRFRYFEKENGGVSSARNLGLERSEGVYITFIDSDDWVESNHLEALLKGIKENNTDIAVSKHKSFNTEDGLFYFPVYSNQNIDNLCIKKKQIRPFLELFPKLNYLTHDFACIASKLFKKSLTQNLFLDEKLPQSEDLDYFFKLYLRAESIVYIDEVTYIYVQHGQNASHHPSETSALCDIKVHWNMLDFINELSIPNYYYLERIKHLLSYWKDRFPDSKGIKMYETMVTNLENDITYPQPLISLVVSIYNVENYLWSCLDSIAKQTYSNIEVLLVNDGSPDDSSSICQEFVAKDSRFRYIEKENGGLSDARNAGIAEAKGEFLSFVDSDDWIEPTYVEDLYRAALLNDAEVVVSNYQEFHQERNVYLIHLFEDYYETHYSGEELIQQLPLLERKDLSFKTSWGILFARRLFDTISFPKGKTIEDTRTNYRLFAESCRSTYIHKALYNHRVGVNSISSRITEKLLVDVLECLMERMAVYAVKGWNVADERENVLTNLKMRYNQAKEVGLQNTDIFKRYAEILYLLSD